MTRRLAATAACILALAVSASALARHPGHFGELDENEDGYATWNEIKSYIPLAKKDEFQAADTNHDGRLDYSEWQASRTKFGLVKPGLGNETKDIKDKDLKQKEASSKASTGGAGHSAGQSAGKPAGKHSGPPDLDKTSSQAHHTTEKE